MVFRYRQAFTHVNCTPDASLNASTGSVANNNSLSHSAEHAPPLTWDLYPHIVCWEGAHYTRAVCSLLVLVLFLPMALR